MNTRVEMPAMVTPMTELISVSRRSRSLGSRGSCNFKDVSLSSWCVERRNFKLSAQASPLHQP